jgi:phosphoribosylanthranilate isomerase
MTFQVKICGITNVDDALIAVEAGANYIGLIFVEASPRCISPSAAASVAAQLRGSDCRLVGVFLNADQAHIEAVRESVALDFVQLHGQETQALCAAVAPAIKAVTSVEDALSFKDHADMILLDRPKTSADAQFIESIAAHPSLPVVPPFLLAGGLNPDNLAATIEMFRDCPTLLGFDAASGVEEAPGRKDAAKVKRFCEIARTGGRYASTR